MRVLPMDWQNSLNENESALYKLIHSTLTLPISLNYVSCEKFVLQ